MNLIIRNRALNPLMPFYSDTYSEREYNNDSIIINRLKRLIKEHNAIMVSWDNEENRRIIFYNFEDKCGKIRAGYFKGREPISHTYDIDYALQEIANTTWFDDVFVKVA